MQSTDLEEIKAALWDQASHPCTRGDWTQDSNGIPDLSWADRLYRHSQRYVARFEKWDRRLGNYTYGQVTLYQAYLKRYLQFSLSLR